MAREVGSLTHFPEGVLRITRGRGNYLASPSLPSSPVLQLAIGGRCRRVSKLGSYVRLQSVTSEVWGKILGTINTRRKFFDHKLELAQHEWSRLKANDSLECRNCHSSLAMG